MAQAQLPDLLPDGNTSFSGGQDDGRCPSEIGKDQVQRAINISFFKNSIQPRYGYRYRYLSFEKESIGGRSVESIFRRGKFQMMKRYRTGTSEALIAIISGIIFRIEQSTGMVLVLHPKGGERLNQYHRRYNGGQMGRFFVIYDWPNTPMIMDGLSVRRSDLKRKQLVFDSTTNTSQYLPLPETPPAVDGIFAGNRQWIRNLVHEYTAGDPIGGINEDAPITFEEVLVPGSDFYKQAFSLGFGNQQNPITGFGLLQSIDTSTGIGSLLVSTDESIFGANVGSLRKNWDNQNFAQPILFGPGLSGPRAGANLNSSFIFVSRDQTARDLSMARDEQHRWSNTPISNEVRPFFFSGDPELIGQAFVEVYKGYGLFGAMPHRVLAVGLEGQAVLDEVHDAFVVLELDSISSLGTPVRPVWAGLWTGIRPLEAARIGEQLFVMSKDVGDVNQLYEVDPSIGFDVYRDTEVAIPTRIYTREMDWQSPNILKEERSVNYDVSEVFGKFKLSVARKRSVDNGYYPWGEAEFEIKEGYGDVESDTMKTLAPHGAEALNLGDPNDPKCDPLTDDSRSIFKRASLRLDIRAKNFRFNNFIFEVKPISDTPQISKPCAEKVVENEVVEELRDDVDLYLLSRDYGIAY